MLDLLIKNGQYPDFVTGEMRKSNIGVADGKITYIGSACPEAANVIDASGNVVSPGFIDIHLCHCTDDAEYGSHHGGRR